MSGWLLALRVSAFGVVFLLALFLMQALRTLAVIQDCRASNYHSALPVLMRSGIF